MRLHRGKKEPKHEPEYTVAEARLKRCGAGPYPEADHWVKSYWTWCKKLRDREKFPDERVKKRLAELPAIIRAEQERRNNPPGEWNGRQWERQANLVEALDAQMRACESRLKDSPWTRPTSSVPLTEPPDSPVRDPFQDG